MLKNLSVLHPAALVARRMAAAAMIMISGTLAASALSGPWRGEVSFSGFRIPIVFNFSERDGSLPACTIDSPSQGAKGIPAEVLVCTPDSLEVDCKAIEARYTALVTPDSIAGTLSQRGISLPLVLRLEEPLSKRRPQTPAGPFPYPVADTTFTATDGTRLAGTLVLPENARVGVVMVSGSGPQNRDEEIFEHRPFAVIADYLARFGIASFRYDDRGTGLSEGDYKSSDINTFAADARAAADFMRGVIGGGKTGVLGHSEGGTIAMMLGARSVPDFVISLAGMAESGKQTIMRQNIRSLDASGIAVVDRENSITFLDRFFNLVIERHKGGTAGQIDVDSLVRTMDIAVPAPIIDSVKASEATLNAEIESLLALDPESFLGNISCPVLALNGALDTQVDAEANIGIISRHIPHATTRIFPSLNHLMQRCKSGDVSEYGQIRQTISPEVLSAILGFISANK